LSAAPALKARPLTIRQQLLLDWIAECAARGEACPSNAAIAERFDLPSCKSGTDLVGALEYARAIRVERFHKRRRVTIVATGAQTALPDKVTPAPWKKPKARKTRTGSTAPTAPPRKAPDAGAEKAPRGKEAAEAPAAAASEPPVAERVRHEVEVIAARRRDARCSGTVKRPRSPVHREERAAQLAAGRLDDAEPSEVIAFVRARWPGQFERIRALAAELACLPGEALFRCIAAGIDLLEADIAEEAA
jgi:hypothetical protein